MPDMVSRMMSCHLFSLFLILPIASGLTEGPTLEKARTVLRRAMVCHEMAGLALAVVRGNETLMSEAFGFSDLQKKRPMTKKNTLLMIASLSKAMTSTVISLTELERRYKYDVNTEIRSFLPEFELVGEQRSSYATMHDLLSHRIGVLRYDLLWMTFRRKNPLKWVKYLENVSQFRSSFKYSNVMYNLAGDILTRLSGQTWSQIMHENLFRPLGMFNARVMGDKNLDRRQLVRSYFNLTGQIDPMSQDLQLSAEYAAPAAGVVLPLSDMIMWMKTLTDIGRLVDSEVPIDIGGIQSAILKTTSASNAYSTSARKSKKVNPQVVNMTNYAPLFPSSYGRGWQRTFYRGRLMLIHYGSLFGVDSFISWFPHNNISVFVSANFIISPRNNEYGDVPRRLNLYLSDLFLGSVPWLDEKNVCGEIFEAAPLKASMMNVDFPPDFVHLRKLTEEERLVLPGVYFNRLFGTLNLHYNETSRRIEFNLGALGRIQLIPARLGNSTEKGEDIIRMLSFVTGPLWFYSSHLKQFGLERAEDSEDIGRSISLMAYKQMTTFVRCPNRKSIIKWLTISVTESIAATSFRRLGAITEGDEEICEACRLKVQGQTCITFLLLCYLWRQNSDRI